MLTHADVADACVVGVPDDYSGEIPMAFVVLRETTLKNIQQNPKETQRIKDSIIKVLIAIFYI